MKDETKVRIAVVLWGAAVIAGITYVDVMITERRKRKAIRDWEYENYLYIKSKRDRLGL